MKVAILTPIKVEQKAVQKHLTDIEKKVVGSRYYVFGKFKGINHKYSILTTRTGSKNAVISLAAEQAIEYFQPDIVLLVGIAGGVKDVEIGDVVVGTKSYGYEAGKEQEGGLVARPESFSGSKELNAVAMAVEDDEMWQERSTFAENSTKVIFGPIAGGDKVIATSKGIIHAFLKQHYNDTIAIEMEAYGFGETLSHHQNIRWLNIRGISDLLDSKSVTDSEGNQQRAAANAAAFAFELLHFLDGSQFVKKAGDQEKGDRSININSSKNVVTGNISTTGNVYIGDGTIHIQEVLNKSATGNSSRIISTNLQSIKDFLSNDQIKEALEALLIFTRDRDPDLHNDIIAQSGRWNRLKKDKRQGVITSGESQIINNRIRYSLLSIIEDLGI